MRAFSIIDANLSSLIKYIGWGAKKPRIAERGD